MSNASDKKLYATMDVIDHLLSVLDTEQPLDEDEFKAGYFKAFEDILHHFVVANRALPSCMLN
ncbi:hypothetical protein ABH994_000559 [Bradyrhizobium yuanmingense]|uniref:hypothetical protein n=1 Tax=Bradyrhizobium yuanmingense TaxID=108015 RepID=UPI00351417D5